MSHRAAWAGLMVMVAVVLLGVPTAGAAVSGTDTARAPGATTLAGTGSPGSGGVGRNAASAQLDGPVAVVEDRSGDLFIADAGSCRVQEVPARTGTAFGLHLRAGALATLVGGSCRNPATHPEPSALAVDAGGDLFIAFGPQARVDELPVRSTTVSARRLTAGRLVGVAGTGTPGDAGDGGPADRSQLDDPTGLAVDADGDVLIGDTANCRVAMVAAGDGTHFGVAMVEGHLYAVAGTGTCGSTGDGGPAVQAEVWDPGALAVDGSGDVLVADQGNRTIRELAAHTGMFFGVAIAADHLGTVAGEGSYGPYVQDGLSALGETAELNFPTGLAVDPAGDLYIADGSMHAIRFVPAATTMLRGKVASADALYLAAGALSSGGILDAKTSWVQTRMVDPTGLTLSPRGQLIYADSQADVVRQLPLRT
jgi:DNA-binding beta-propeller fold protein YncE